MQTKLDLKSMILGSVLTAAIMLSIAATNTNQDTNRLAATGDNQIERVNGIGGVFFKARDPKKMRAWYRDHLGIDATKAGYVNFDWREKDNPERLGRTVWTLFPTNSTYFTAPLMINYRVANLDRLLAQLRRDGVEVNKTQDFDYGRFAWITDPEGNKIELWEPIIKPRPLQNIEFPCL